MTTSPPAPPSGAQLVRATGLAVVVAAMALAAVVLPAEFGLDPLGTGRALGLVRPRVETAPGTASPDGAAATMSPADALFRSPTPYKTDEMSVTLDPGEGAEIKARMRQGERMVYSWTATGEGVDVDMHGDLLGAPEGEFTSYWKDEFQTGDHGAFTAPGAGNHGWFWQNVTDETVTVTVRVSGFYERLFRP
ncbi:MAG: hypothetical protein R2745_01285 [Vicinamibacterales bacterium]